MSSSKISSTAPSKTDTLLPPNDEHTSPLASGGLEDEDDRPVFVEQFKENVRRCKTVVSLGLPITLVLEVTHLVSAFQEDGNWNDSQRLTVSAVKGCDGLGVIVATSTTLLFLASLIYPIRIQNISLDSQIKNINIHRTLCTGLFLSSLVMIGVHALPGVIYTVVTHRGPPVINLTINYARTAALLFTLISVGCMRRGPKLYSAPANLGTAFGLNREKDDNLTSPANVIIKITPADEGSEPTTSNILLEDQSNAATLEQREEKCNVYDYANSSMLDFVFLSFSASIAKRSMSVPSLTQADLPVLEAYTRNGGIRHSVYSASEPEHSHGSSSRKVTEWALVKSLWAGRGTIILVSFLLETTKNAISFLQIIALYEIINNFGEAKDGDRSYLYLCCWGLFAGQAVEVLMSAYCCVRENYMLHVPIKMTLSSMLFAKILRTTDAKAMEAHNTINDENKEDQSRGRSQVMNLLTIDTGTIASMATYTWNFANGMVTLIIGAVMLFSMLGVSACVGIACIPLATPFSYLVSRFIYRCDKEWARARDARTGALKEFLLGIKVIKLNAFEPYFMRKVRRLREHEVMWQRWRYTLGTAFNILADQIPVISILITFAFHTKIMGKTLEPATAFVALRVFNRIKDGLQTFPQIIQTFLTTRVALGRLSRFLNQPELEQERHDDVCQQVICQNATIGWPRADDQVKQGNATPTFKLEDVDFRLPEGHLTLVCGPLGSGKTLLLRAFLGEAKVESGSVLAPRSNPNATPVKPDDSQRRWTTAEWLNDSIAYSPQQSFIRHGTIRDNILFGQPLWRERYRQALRQAALEPDLDIMEDGDLTEVGEHGVTLSGGQKARVNLARCLYSRAKTVYLDDIFSAVDAHTAQFLYTECLRGSLLRGRTVVLVSHHVTLVLPTAEYVISLRDGRVEQACPANQAKLATLESLELEDVSLPTQADTMEEPGSSNNLTSVAKAREERDESSQVPRHLYRAEHQAIGRVATSHYMLIFASAGGKWYWLVLALLFAAYRALDVLRSYILARWSSDSNADHLNYYLTTWGGAVFISVIIGGFRWVWLYGIGNVGFYSAGSKKVHESLLASVFAAPLGFFETTPQGRLLNVFGQDMYRLDSQSADSFGRTVMQALAFATGTIIVCWETPVISVVVLCFGIPLYWISGHMNKLRSDIRRLTAKASSPLYSIYNETIDGVVMVRAFGQNQLMMAAMKVLINRERVTSTADWTVYNWVKAVIRSIASVIVAATGFALIGADISPAKAGFILSFALATSQGLFDLMEQYSGLEQTFVSAERINHYITMDEREPTDGVIPEKDWPSRGEIKVENLCMRYAPDLPDVLHDLSFNLEPGTRVGLVGATGSGKSSLALSLFIPVEPHAGRITIDGIDIASISLPYLRERLNMVTQDGMLCSGTLRDALDVTGLKDDHEIYEALRRVHLISDTLTKDEMDNNPFANLETYVAVEGANFSQGERQLLCLARALLKKSKILVMDEATSSVDFEMDAKITATIKECFSETTMLVIAHRLATIMQYDRVLVLDKGRILEFGEPRQLMKDSQSAFHKLCMAQGEEEFDTLMALAKM